MTTRTGLGDSEPHNRHAVHVWQHEGATVRVAVDLDGQGQATITSGNDILDRLLAQFVRHGRFDLYVNCQGEAIRETSKKVERVALGLGEAFGQALGTEPRIARYGVAYVPRNEALSRVTVDLLGRAQLVYRTAATATGDEVLGISEAFWRSFVAAVPCTLHVETLYGEDPHAITASVFRAAARALFHASRPDARSKRTGSLA